MPEGFDRKNNDSTERQKQRLVIEIGCGRNPHLLFGASREYSRRMSDDQQMRYVGIDLDEEDLGQAKNKIARRAKAMRLPSDRIDFVRAKGGWLPFENESAVEVIVRNVLGDPDIYSDYKIQMLDEAMRVLKPRGVLKIIEQYTPDAANREYLLAHIAKMINAGTAEVVSVSDLSPDEISSDKLMREYQLAEPDAFVTRLRKAARITER